MALSIKNEHADELARELARLTGTSITEAVVTALEQEVRRQKAKPGVGEALRQLSRELANYPVLDDRPADEILGYDEFGLPN
jgi:antitoxin VapB